MNYDDWKQTAPECDNSKYWTELDIVRDRILDSLTELEKAAIFQDIEEFKYLKEQENELTHSDI